jgi:hypothetical protein
MIRGGFFRGAEEGTLLEKLGEWKVPALGFVMGVHFTELLWIKADTLPTFTVLHLFVLLRTFMIARVSARIFPGFIDADWNNYIFGCLLGILTYNCGPILLPAIVNSVEKLIQGEEMSLTPSM